MRKYGYISLIGLWTTLASSGLIISLFLTAPSSIGPVGVTVWFIAFWTALSGFMTLLLYGLKRYLRLHTSSNQRLRYSIRQGLLLGGFITIISAISSLGLFNLRDVILIAIILIIFEFYMRLTRP
jgi:hypothetical protein